MMSEALTIRVPTIPEKIEIGVEWIERRNKILIASADITSVQSQDDYEAAEILLKKITSASNDAEKLRKNLSLPFTDLAKRIKKMGDDARNPLEEDKLRLKKIMSVFLREEEARQQADLRRIAEEAAREADAALLKEAEEAGKKFNNPFAEFIPDSEESEVLPAEPVAIESNVGNVNKSFSRAKKVWKFEIENESSVPREFCSPDEKKIREYVNREKDAASITGVRTWEELAVQSR